MHNIEAKTLQVGKPKQARGEQYRYEVGVEGIILEVSQVIPTPREICEALDKFVIGVEHSEKVVIQSEMVIFSKLVGGLVMTTPLKFSNMICHRLEALQFAFDTAIVRQRYDSRFQGVYPVKCN
ncbi:hypothetical protein SUGI_0989650 [Cryptomeria japonica]|nr:hypothetical protein SUGI_0989650 [Cryptomeria japonica]